LSVDLVQDHRFPQEVIFMGEFCDFDRIIYVEVLWTWWNNFRTSF